MLLLIVSWLLLTASTLSLGAAVLHMLKAAGQPVKAPVIVVVGLAAASVLLATWSIFLPLGGYWGGLLFCASLLPLAWSPVRAILRASVIRQPGNTVAAPALAYLFATALLKAAGPTEIFDDAVAYLPIFRSTLDDGIIIGLGNLHPNLAYNSHWSLLGAFYSFEWLFGRALYDINGWVVWVGGWYAFSFLPELWAGRVRGLYLLIAATPFFYFRNQMSGNSTDLPVSIITWLILTEWLLGAGRENPKLARLLFVALPVFAFTIKVTAISLLILPLALLWEERPLDRKATLAFGIASVSVILAPWFARNVLMTGYLYFLAPALDLFSVDWKVPLTVIGRLKAQVAGDIHHGPKQLGDPAWWQEWWYQGLNLQNRTIVGLAFGSMVIGAVAALFRLGRLGQAERSSRLMAFCLIQAIGLLFWFSAATEPRYGHAALTFASLGLLCWGVARLPQGWLPLPGKGFVTGITLLMALAALRSYKEFTPFVMEVAVWPAPYPEVEWQIVQGSNFTANFPYRLITPLNDRLRFPAVHTAGREKYPNCWCTPMPCLYRREDLPLLQRRGPTLRDGFRFKKAPKD